jgi:hypothetical protein
MPFAGELSYDLSFACVFHTKLAMLFFSFSLLFPLPKPALTLFSLPFESLGCDGQASDEFY